MLLANTLLFLLLPLALVGAISHEEKPENIPPKSEIVFRIKRLMQMLRDRRKQDVEKVREVQEALSSRSMIERRRQLEEVLRENPGLSALIKNSLNKRREEEVRMLENDPRRRCRPGIFFCKKSRDQVSTEDAASLKKLSKLDDEIGKRRRCRPGLFWCDKNDATATTDTQTQKKSLDLPKIKDDMKQETKQDVIDRIVSIISKEQEDPQKRRRCRPGMFTCVQRDEDRNVEILRVPADSPRAGEKLADDLMESVNKKNAKDSDDSPQSEKTSFDVKQITKILESYKR
ncbi:uncharacterized protein LOC116303308 [Actinia tenebrosa]|uniref:Uncharacterized protein LOC116303308 n=1 Tax=Actinia tenebrosa TaxID=6105 RepID=A0A6P8INS4_ACTTE|nr:uncharacterized protein LOC116303308 [Actinia tenebrosa]XP_031568691.1 uncharacterized protein LOC116303308 [Actinia tenebrosa]XP_031568693.1 uncharacterized protein LOC116303308 [Actinia tenebrosa]